LFGGQDVKLGGERASMKRSGTIKMAKKVNDRTTILFDSEKH